MKSSISGKRKTGWIYRDFNTRKRREIFILYKALVFPLLEYCCPLWCPTNQNFGLFRALENDQRSFFGGILGLTELNLWDKLRGLKLNTLEMRRDRYVIKYEWKILHKLGQNFAYDVMQEYTDER